MTPPGGRGAARRRRWAAGGAVVGLAFVVAAAVAAQEEFTVPDFLSAEDQRAAPTPDAGQQVLVVDVRLTSEGERVTGEVASQQIVSNFAPKSVARSAGEWEIRVQGETPLTYLVPNPLLDVEVENPGNVDDPFDYVPTETLDWTLVVPLYVDGQALGATSVQVVDTTTGAVVLETAVEARPPG